MVLKIIKENIPHRNKELSKALNKLEEYEKGKINPNHYKSARLDEGLRDLIKVLCKNGYRNLLSGILPKNAKDEELIRGYAHYNLSKKLSLRWGKSWELKEKKETELWGAYGKLQLVFRVIHLGKEYLNTLKKYPDEYDKYLGFLEEMEIIKNDGKRPLLSLIPSPKRDSLFNYRNKEFKKDNYKLYTTRIHNYLIQESSEKEDEKPIKKQFKETILYLNPNGNLYRKPKIKYCYEMGEKSDRHKIVRFLAQNRSHQPTQLIAVKAGNKNEQTTRTEIGKIRENIEKYLKIKDKDLLQGKKGSGYRINPKYKIILKNE